MPKRKRTREVTVKDVRTILRLSCAEGLSVREIADRLRIGKSSVSGICEICTRLQSVGRRATTRGGTELIE